MADNDIQFLGNWDSQASSHNAYVSAIVLTPLDGSPSRTFSRMHTSLITIGRKVASAPMEVDPTDESAGFTNPVMSRKHAKIKFADSGSAFIIDTNSHHGTLVSRPNSAKPQIRLMPESPLMLLDGDEVTLGKPVVKDGVKYQPLTLSVKLLRGNPSPFSCSATTPPNNISSPKPRNRFWLASTSPSASSDSEDECEQPGDGSGTFYLDLPLNSSTDGFKSSEVVDPGLPLDRHASVKVSSPSVQKSPTPPHSPPHPSEAAEISASVHPQESSHIEPPGLELSAIGNRPEGSSVSTGASPWNFDIAPVSVHLSDATYVPPANGRALNSSEVHEMRMEAMGDSPAPDGLVRMHGEISSTYTVRRNGHERSHDSVGRPMYEYDRKGRQITDVPLRLLHDSDLIPGEDDEPLTKSPHESLSARLAELTTQLIALQDNFHGLESKAQSHDIENLKDTFTSLQTTVATFKADTSTLQDCTSAIHVDLGALRVDLSTLRTAYKGDIENLQEKATVQATDFKGLLAGLDKLRADGSSFQLGVESITKEIEDLKSNLDDMRNIITKLQLDFTGLESEISLGRHSTGEVTKRVEDMEEIILKRIRSEIEQFVSLSVEASVGTKRKRGEEDCRDHDNASTLTSMEARPRKRLRTIVTAGLLGAIGTYIGLAYLPV